MTCTRFDFSGCMTSAPESDFYLTWSEIEALLPCLERAHDHLARHRDPEQHHTGEQFHNWRNLPYDREALAKVVEYARCNQSWIDAVVMLGIGGSGLGPIVLQKALLPPFHNELPRGVRNGPRLYVMDNVDPKPLVDLLAMLDPRQTLVIVATKSGGTVETLAAYMVVRKWLEKAVQDEIHRHLAFITRPRGGALRALLEKEKRIPSFEVPNGVGGRFSVLCPVGTLPAALCGIDVQALLEGAAAMDQRCKRSDLVRNPAAMFAAVHYLLDTRKGKSVHVMMPYAQALKEMADWFAQLWAESLGKAHGLDGAPAFCGQTPVKALGATDQHSLIQMLVEGPFDKVVTFISVEKLSATQDVPAIHSDIDALAYLNGSELGNILHIEESATRLALRDAGRPSCTITLPEVNAYSVGELFYLLEVATAYAGCLYGVNAFDQPGVEQGKYYTFGALGRKGYESYGIRLAAAQRKTEDRYVIGE